MFHVVESCPLTKLNGGLPRLHSADEDAVSWLTSYGSWHAYEKKKIQENKRGCFFPKHGVFLCFVAGYAQHFLKFSFILVDISKCLFTKMKGFVHFWNTVYFCAPAGLTPNSFPYVIPFNVIAHSLQFRRVSVVCRIVAAETECEIGCCNRYQNRTETAV